MENVQPCFVYVLQCADGTFYTGWTNNLPARLAAHNARRGAKYTRTRLPVRLVYCEPCTGKSAALRREYAIKQMPRAQKCMLVFGMEGERP